MRDHLSHIHFSGNPQLLLYHDEKELNGIMGVFEELLEDVEIER